MIDKILHKNLRIPYKLRYEQLRKNQKSRATVIFIHGLASSVDMWREAETSIEGDFDLFAVDLLGHGNSPKPSWDGALSLDIQARAIRRSIIQLNKLGNPLFLVGHSMGSLVAAEYAKKYPNTIGGIFLLSPPIYSKEEARGSIQEWFLKRNLKRIIKYPEASIKVVNGVIGSGLVDVNKFKSQEQFRPIRKSLKEAIIKQDTIDVLSNVSIPTKIIYGAFDPVIIGSNIRKLASINPSIKAVRVLASHNPTKDMILKVSSGIEKILKGNN